MARVSPSPPPVTDATPPRVARDRSTVRLLLISMRPEQWTKNLLVLAGVVFGGRLMDPAAVAIALGGVRDLLRAVGRGLSVQRRRRSRSRPEPPAEARAADRIGPALGDDGAARRPCPRRRRGPGGVHDPHRARDRRRRVLDAAADLFRCAEACRDRGRAHDCGRLRASRDRGRGRRERARSGTGCWSARRCWRSFSP